MKTPNAPAPEESLSLSFDEGSNNFNKNYQQKTKENTKTLAPHFKQTPNPTKPGLNKSNNSKVPRQPFKQITPQDQGNSQNGFLSRGKPVLTGRNQVTRKREDKENTPLTSKYVTQGNIKSLFADTGGNVQSFSGRNEKILRSQSVGDHQRKVLPDQNPSNRRVSAEVTHVKKRKRYNSEEVQSYQIIQQPSNRTRAISHSSLTLSDDDSLSDISLDSSISKKNEMRRLPSKSPSNLNNSNQISPKHFSKPSPSNSEYLSETCMSKQQTDSSKLKYQSSRDDVDIKKQNNSNVCQNSPNFSGNVSSHGRSPKLTDHDVQCTAVTSKNSKRQSRSGESPRQSNSYTDGRRVSDMVMRQPLPSNSNTGAPVVCQGNPRLGNNLKQCDSRDSFNSGHNMYGAPRDVVNIPTNKPFVNPSHQQNVVPKSRDLPKQPSNRRFANASETKYDHMILDTGIISEPTPDTFMKTDSESSTKCNNQKSSPNRPSNESLSASDHSKNKSENCSLQQSLNACNDSSRLISPVRVSNDSLHHSPRRYASHRFNCEMASQSGNFVFVDAETQKIARREVIQQQKKEEKHSSNLELEEQVKRQEDMIRVLQEQVRFFSIRIGFSAADVLKFSQVGV